MKQQLNQISEFLGRDPIVPVSAALGALKGAAVGIVVGKIGAMMVVGAVGGALVGAGISAIRRAADAEAALPPELAFEQHGC